MGPSLLPVHRCHDLNASQVAQNLQVAAVRGEPGAGDGRVLGGFGVVALHQLDQRRDGVCMQTIAREKQNRNRSYAHARYRIPIHKERTPNFKFLQSVETCGHRFSH